MHSLRARAILLVFEKFTRAYLFQTTLESMWLSIQITVFMKDAGRNYRISGLRHASVLCLRSFGSSPSWCGAILYRPVLSGSAVCDFDGRFVLAEFTLHDSVFRVGWWYAPNRNPDCDAFLHCWIDSINQSIPTLLCDDFNTVLDRVVDGRGSCPLIWHLSWEFNCIVCFFSWLLCGWRLASQAPRCAWSHVVQEGRCLSWLPALILRSAHTPGSLLFLLQTYCLALTLTTLLFIFLGLLFLLHPLALVFGNWILLFWRRRIISDFWLSWRQLR